MERTSKALGSLIDYATKGSQPRYWLPALHILKTVEAGLFSSEGRPHPLLTYLLPGNGIDFSAMLTELHFTASQRQAVLAAWELFNGGDRDGGPRAEFQQVCFRLDERNFRAVMDGMRVRTGRDPGGEIQQRLLGELLAILKRWQAAGL